MAINRDSLLELTPLIRAAAQYANGNFKSERHFLDFVVDGHSLWEALEATAQPEEFEEESGRRQAEARLAASTLTFARGRQ